MTIDHLMQVEEFGAAASDPTGRWLVYERLRPYGQSDDFSFRNYAMGKTGHQLWRHDLRTGDTELLPGVDPTPHSYQQGFSKSGRFLAIMQYRLGTLSLGAYDMATNKTVRFSDTPAFSRDGTHNPVWISEEELVFAALPDDDSPILTSVRAHTGRTLAKAWKHAWRGDVVTASEVRTRTPDQSTEQQAGYLVRANASTGESQIIIEGLYADLRVSPNGRLLAALAVSKQRSVDPNRPVELDPRRFSLTLLNLDTGEMRPLAPELEVFPYSIAWAHDSTRVVAYGWTAGEGPRTGRFYVVDVETGVVTQHDHVGLELTSERERGWRQRPERVSFLGDDLAVFARRIPDSEDQAPRFTYQNVNPVKHSKPDWYVLSAHGAPRNLTHDLAGVGAVPVHAGKDHITVLADDGVYRLYADGQRRRLTPPLSGRFRFLSLGTFMTRSGVIRPEFGNEALFGVSGSGAAQIVMVDLRDGHEGETVVVNAPSADATPLAGSLAAGSVLFRTEDGQASRLLVATANSESPLELSRINSHLNNLDLGHWEIVSYEVEDPDGNRPPERIESCVLLPPGYSPSTPPPLIVEVYPGVGPRCKSGPEKIDSLSVSWSPYLWAGKGYAYARLTTPRSLSRTDEGPLVGMPNLLGAGVDVLVENGFADPERVAAVGFSQGGVSALYVAAKSERYKAVIAMNSWADLFSHYFGANGVFSYVYDENFGSFARYDATVGSDFGIGRTPFEDPASYYRNSPVFLAPSINVPVLLIHSDMDSFSMSQFDEMYGALLRAGKDARYVRYWGEGHGPSSPANIRDLWERIDSFLFENSVAPEIPR
ncbi:prolyl oligopeptidase family serine peptidase [Luteimonas sp. BDR2-5]|uniref:S9 family peptidase n=1 Tax=Proluteimonas luteida TaxID=2878685 RepID=UPI001E5FBE8A|nr:prolyl oligopeptidase family serine peptidase [Luteimonas sp. BDR2-5]MCD9026628.1 prolyl oligopeptidase family serine peptidase [Luteimonas sp. BDR2-5]